MSPAGDDPKPAGPKTPHKNSQKQENGKPKRGAKLEPKTGEADLEPEILPPALAKALTSGDRQSVMAVAKMIMGYSGPLPPPDMLKEYGDALPNGSERIVANWEAESTHRRKLQNRGQLIATAVVVAALIAAVICALNGQPWVGGTIVLAAMLGVGAQGILKFFLHKD